MSCSPTAGDTTESLWSTRDKDKEAGKADDVISTAVRQRDGGRVLVFTHLPLSTATFATIFGGRSTK